MKHDRIHVPQNTSAQNRSTYKNEIRIVHFGHVGWQKMYSPQVPYLAKGNLEASFIFNFSAMYVEHLQCKAHRNT